jgi:hypothetical protein
LRSFQTPAKSSTSLAIAAQALLGACAARDPDQPAPQPAAQPQLPPLIPITVAEARRLFTGLLIHRVHKIGHLLRWSYWRRRHQAHARAAHHRHRLAIELSR